MKTNNASTRKMTVLIPCALAVVFSAGFSGCTKKPEPAKIEHGLLLTTGNDIEKWIEWQRETGDWIIGPPTPATNSETMTMVVRLSPRAASEFNAWLNSKRH